MAPPNRLTKLRQARQPLISRTQDATAQVLEPVAQAVGATPIMGAPPPPWLKPNIISTSGYAQGPSSPAVPLPVTAYHRDALGYVHGKVALITAAGAAGGVVAFMLEGGWRPAELVPLVMGDGGGNIWEATVSPDGSFTVQSALAAGDLITGVFTFLAER